MECRPAHAAHPRLFPSRHQGGGADPAIAGIPRDCGPSGGGRLGVRLSDPEPRGPDAELPRVGAGRVERGALLRLRVVGERVPAGAGAGRRRLRRGRPRGGLRRRAGAGGAGRGSRGVRRIRCEPGSAGCQPAGTAVGPAGCAGRGLSAGPGRAGRGAGRSGAGLRARRTDPARFCRAGVLAESGRVGPGDGGAVPVGVLAGGEAGPAADGAPAGQVARGRPGAAHGVDAPGLVEREDRARDDGWPGGGADSFSRCWFPHRRRLCRLRFQLRRCRGVGRRRGRRARCLRQRGDGVRAGGEQAGPRRAGSQEPVGAAGGRGLERCRLGRRGRCGGAGGSAAGCAEPVRGRDPQRVVHAGRGQLDRGPPDGAARRPGAGCVPGLR